MKKWHVSMGLSSVTLCTFITGAFTAPIAKTQTTGRQSTTPATNASASRDTTAEPDARAELQTGTELTRRGSLQEAIPHLLAAQKAGADPYATSVNLGICYLGTNNYQQAIAVLEALRASGRGTADVNNLLTQAYLGTGQTDLALKVFLEAAAATPKNEDLYAFIADACTDHQDYSLGLHIVELGLLQLPGSARLHYERAVFLARLGRFDEAKPEFDRAAQLAPDSYIGYLALVQKDLYEDNLSGATQLLHLAIKAGHSDYRMLSLLGSVLLHNGASPGRPEFAEAQAALEESAKERPDYSATQIALGQLYLRAGRYNDAVTHLEIGRTLEPNNPAVYAGLANAYGKLGDRDKARQMEEQITRLLAEKKSTPIQPHP
jgi:tetratricopeptide (TPR) repeat protein